MTPLEQEAARVRDRLSEILDEVKDSFGKPFHPQERENLTVAVLENMAEQTVALKARAQAAEQSLAAADQLARAAEVLLVLKDGPGGTDYEARKPLAWDHLREAAQHYRNTRAPAQEHRSAEEGG